MLINYLKIIYRNLLKGKVFSLINVLGLAVGIGSALLIVHYVRFERSYENFHTKADNIYRLTLDLYKGSEYVITDCEMYAPVGQMLREQNAEVLDFVRMYNQSNVEVQAGNVRFFENQLYFADSSLFNVFTVTMLHGNAGTALSRPWQAVVTERIARKYFGSTDATGKTLDIDHKLYTVTGVIADLPPNTHLKYDILLSHVTLPQIWPTWYGDDKWGGNNEYMYLLMAPGTDLAQFNRKLVAFSQALKDKLGSNRIVAEHMKDIHLYSNKSYEPEPNGDARIVYFLLIIAVFIMIIAWVNYINLATARAIDRAREVGIRKVMGSARMQLIAQFLMEAAFMNFVASLLGLVFFQTTLPYFRLLAGQPLPLDVYQDSTLWYITAGLFIAGTMVSGGYPAFVLSSFLPVTVLKGRFRSSGHGQWLRKGLVVVQFGATVVLLICVVTVYRQIDFLQHQRLGMNLGRTLALRGPRISAKDSVYNERYTALKTALLQLPYVQSVARSEAVPGLSMHEVNTTSYITRLGQNEKEGSYNYYLFDIDEDFIPTLRIEFAAGRNFSNTAGNADQVIINEEAVRTLGFSSAEEAVGSRITYRTRWEGPPSTIIGVVKNFNHRSPKEAYLPMLFRYDIFANYVSVRLTTDDMPRAIGQIHRTWKTLFPNNTFEYFFLEEQYNRQYQADRQFGQVTATFSVLAVFIACLGLFGLSSFTIVQRTKEIGVRKVLGASVVQIVQLLVIDFLKLVMLASVLALPVALWAMNLWLRNYAVHAPFSAWMFIAPVAAIVVIAFGTVGMQTLKASAENPAKALNVD
jgi:putative ABC transport system permease protein